MSWTECSGPFLAKRGCSDRGQRGTPYVTGLLRTARPSHIVISFVVADVTHVKYHRNVPEILPPVCGAVGFSADLTGFVNDGSGAIAGKLQDFALLDEDQCGSIIVTVPGDYATRLNDKFAEAQFMVGELHSLLAKID